MKRVMVIDDANDQLMLMKSVFKMVDPTISVQIAHSGDDALKTLRKDPAQKPHVIFLDLKMPGKNGHEVLSELKSDPDLKRIPVCMLSNADLEHEVCASYTLGASFYFKKPSALDDLIQFLHNFKMIAQKNAFFCQH